ncbi:MAG: hypothetical protein [Wendovervirus sonii]|uniref:Uncharacterized protein n=1 Tax=phage Lak_Megaphage_Sonny TaxID=3109229 RepID=A0ABZ0Z3N6_9CAUD|nr:MAG: hypothetical protein [phage Lak_Megaphage_Sonny]
MKFKNYHSDFTDKMQKAINVNAYEMNDLQSWDDMPRRIRIGGVYINLTMSDDNVPSSYNQVDEDINTEEFQKWAKAAAGRFYGKDWRMSFKKPSVYKLYRFLNIDIDGIKANMLIRKITNDDLKATEEFDTLTDLMINDEPYVIIKAYSADENSDEFFNFDSIFENKNNKSNTDEHMTSHIDIPSDDDFESIPDNIEETEELF